MTFLSSSIKEQAENAVAALLKLAQKKQKKSLSSTLDHEVFNLQLAFKKVPSVKNKIIKVPMPHTLVRDSTDICLFVKDLEGKTKQRDYEPTERHYCDLLASKGLRQSIKVLPLKCLKLEYQPYEAKKNLSNMYDVFLSDENIVRLLPGLLGKHFIARKKYPKQVNLSAKDLKKEINKVLSTELCVISGRGSSCQVSIGHSGLGQSQILENVLAAAATLADAIPGSEANIRSLHLKTVSSPSIPIYVSLGKNTEVSLPKVQRVNQEIEPQEVTTVRGAFVKISKKGRIELVKQDEDDENKADVSSVSEQVPKKMEKASKNFKKRKLLSKDESEDVDHSSEPDLKKRPTAKKLEKTTKKVTTKVAQKKTVKASTKISKLSKRKTFVESATKKRKIVK